MTVAVELLPEFIGPDRCAGDPLIIISDDGEVVVVEQVVQAPLGAAATTVTSVVQMRDDYVAAGRTYADVAAWADGSAAAPAGDVAP